MLCLIAVLLLVTRVFAALGERARIPAIIGESIAGVALQAGLFAKPGPTPIILDSLFSSTVITAPVKTLLKPGILCLAPPSSFE